MVRGAKAAFVFVALTSAITALLGLVGLVMSQVFMDRLLTGANASWTVPFLVLLSVFFLIQIVLSALNAIYLMRVEGKIAASSNAAFLWKVLHLPMEFFSQRLVGDIAQRMGTNGQIAHRLSIIRRCDRIVVLDAGHIVEDGAYDELLAENGLFAELHMKDDKYYA